MRKVRLGMRTIKTAVAVMVCILLFQLTNRGTPMIACLSAVFAMRQDISSSFKFGTSRLKGNSLGAIAALVYAFAIHFFGPHFYFDLFLVPLLVIFVIVSNDAMKNNAGIIGGNAAMLIIVFTIPNSSSLDYAFERVVDTFIGVFVAIAVNYILTRPRFLRKIEEEEDAEDLAEMKFEVAVMSENISKEEKRLAEQKKKTAHSKS